MKKNIKYEKGNLMNKPIIFSLFLILITNIYSREIAITIDDLPSQHNNPTSELLAMHDQILKALQTYQVPATGFVNESKLNIKNDFQKNIEILQMWINFGHILGNHTYSHPAFSKTSLNDYLNDILKGETISKQLMEQSGLKYSYFRHPYLDTGTDIEKRSALESFLNNNKYIIAPVTIDCNDWVFNKYLYLLKNTDKEESIIKNYFQYIKDSIIFTENASQLIFGRNIKHILLLHINLFTTKTIEQLLKLLKDLGYTFISLDAALQDPAYQEIDQYYGDTWPTWLYRWDFTKGIKADWHTMPNPNNYLQ